MTLDGVIQNEENDSDGFKYGGWFFPYADEVTGAVVQERLAKPMDLLLGRKTFDGWETYWPTHSNFWPNVMTATKYVASNTRDSSDWQPNVFLSGDIASDGGNCPTASRGVSSSGLYVAQLLVMWAGRHNLVLSVLFLHYGREPDGPLWLFKLDVAYGQHHYLQ